MATIAEILADPNFQSLLAGIGARLDPEGVGGALGGATTQFIQSRAAQNAVTKQDEQRQTSNDLAVAMMLPEGEQKTFFLNRAMNRLGGLTPKGQPGVTGLTMGPDGSATLKMDLPGQQPAQPNAPMNPQGPYSQNVPQVAARTVPTINTSPPARRNLTDMVPF